MNNEMVTKEDGKIVLEESIVKELNKFQKQKLKMDLMQEELKDKIKAAMENNGIDKYVSPDGTIVINYFPAKTSKRFDTSRFKEEKKELYDEYLKDSTTSSFVKITVK